MRTYSTDLPYRLAWLVDHDRPALLELLAGLPDDILHAALAEQATATIPPDDQRRPEGAQPV